MNQKTMESLLKDEAFVGKLLEAASVSEMRALVEAEGVQVPEEELAAFKQAMDERAAAGGKQALSDDDLEQVTGGVFTVSSSNALDFDVVQILWKAVSEMFLKSAKKEAKDFLREHKPGKELI